MDLLNTLISVEAIRAITIYTFLAVITLCFIKNVLVTNQSGSLGTQKIIGGLSVFVVAILSENEWVFLVSLFIGGLIIASEDFMEKLVIILRSRSEDIGGNLKYSEATPSEINEKQKDEADADDISKIKNRLEKKLKETKKALEQSQRRANAPLTIAKVQKIEKHVNSYLYEKYGTSFHSQVRISTKSAPGMVADGILTDDKGTITTVFEIKYLSSLAVAEFYFRRILEHLRFYFRTQKIIICFVSEKITKSEISRISKLKSGYEFENNSTVIFFEFNDDNLKKIAEI